MGFRHHRSNSHRLLQKKKNSNSHRKKIVILTVWAANLTQILILRASVILSCALKFKNLPTSVSEFTIMPLFHFISKTQTAFLFWRGVGNGVGVGWWSDTLSQDKRNFSIFEHYYPKPPECYDFFFFNYYSVGIVLGFQNLCHRIVTITMEYGGLLGFLFFGGALTEGIILV